MINKAIYLAAPYGRRQYLREDVAPALREAGHRVTSSWINDPKENDAIADYARSRKTGIVAVNSAYDKVLFHEALRDWLDIQHSDALIRFPAEDCITPSSGGKFVEMGAAMAYGLRVFVVGNKECVFDYIDLVEIVPSLEEVIERLK